MKRAVQRRKNQNPVIKNGRKRERVNQSVRDDPNPSEARKWFKCNIDYQNFPGYNQRTWLQQDGATSHMSNTSLPRVREISPGNLISSRDDINWPPHSPDLTPMDFFLWGYLISKVYANKSTSLSHLRENIRHEMAAITESTCRAVIRNFTVRLNECREREGLHLDDIIFKK